MEATLADAGLLRNFAKLLDEERKHFEAIKNDMDRALNGFVWDDEVAHNFKTRYEDGLAPLKTNLFPAMEAYVPHLRDEAVLIEEYLNNQ